MPSNPSSQPSRIPTMQPSFKPIMQPSSKPSQIPSFVPTKQPSSQPTSRPTSLSAKNIMAAATSSKGFFSSTANIIIISVSGFVCVLLVAVSAFCIHQKVEENAKAAKSVWEDERVADSVRRSSPIEEDSHGRFQQNNGSNDNDEESPPTWNYPSPTYSPGYDSPSSPYYDYGDTPIQATPGLIRRSSSPLQSSPTSPPPSSLIDGRSNFTSSPSSPADSDTMSDFDDSDLDERDISSPNRQRSSNRDFSPNSRSRRGSTSSVDSISLYGDQNDSELYDVYQRQTQMEFDAMLGRKGIMYQIISYHVTTWTSTNHTHAKCTFI